MTCISVWKSVLATKQPEGKYEEERCDDSMLANDVPPGEHVLYVHIYILSFGWDIRSKISDKQAILCHSSLLKGSFHTVAAWRLHH